MKVRLVCTSKRRVPKNAILSFSGCAISITSPLLMSCAARSTLAGFMWLPEPRSSAAPHFDGQRTDSAGTVHVCACDHGAPKRDHEHHRQSECPHVLASALVCSRGHLAAEVTGIRMRR